MLSTRHSSTPPGRILLPIHIGTGGSVCEPSIEKSLGGHGERGAAATNSDSIALNDICDLKLWRSRALCDRNFALPAVLCRMVRQYGAPPWAPPSARHVDGDLRDF